MLAHPLDEFIREPRIVYFPMEIAPHTQYHKQEYVIFPLLQKPIWIRSWHC